MAYFISELKSTGDDSTGDPTSAPSLSSPIVPSPWSSPRKVESPHPVRDDYQCCKTVVIPGASCLFVTFDPRCATQYEYDKVRQIISLVFIGNLLLCLHKKCFCKRTVVGIWLWCTQEVWEHSRSVSVARGAAESNSGFRPPPFADVTLSDIEETAPRSSLSDLNYALIHLLVLFLFIGLLQNKLTTYWKWLKFSA